MNLLPHRFTCLSDAIAYATLTKGIVYAFGTIYKVYLGNCPQPRNINAVWSSPQISDDTLAEWLMAI